MAWSAPMTAVANTVFTAAQFNQHVRDNLNETAPAKATASGGYFVATGVNAIAQRFADSATDLTSGTRSLSTAYGDLSGSSVGPTVTVETGTMALVAIRCELENSGTGTCRMSYDVSGATSIAANDSRSFGFGGVATAPSISGISVLHIGGTSLTPGTNTFTAKYRITTGTGTFRQRSIVVLPL